MISIHAPAKGATYAIVTAGSGVLFQSTLPRRERHQCAVSWSTAVSFQSTLPRRERPAVGVPAAKVANFNPRSREGSDVRSFPMRCAALYFNPRSREGSDARVARARRFLSIFQSTLPRRERRHGDVLVLRCRSISIHAPAKGATSYRHACRPRPRYFNPRSREGSDQDYYTRDIQSSHFNPRSREGSDSHSLLNRRISSLFQSTLPRRERLGIRLADSPFLRHFNPRSREGSDR